MQRLLSILLLLLSFSVFAQNKKICITVDDLPAVTYGINDPDFKRELTQGLLEAFSIYEIPAIGYVNEVGIHTDAVLDSAKLRLLEMWLESGNELGNHTYSHMNYHRSSFEDYTADILKGEVMIRPLMEKHNLALEYFRHPYLRSGESQERSDSLKVFLSENGYTESPVTIDTDDYLFAKAYHVAYMKNDSSLMKRIGRDYVGYMERKVLYFEKLSEAVFGRNIAHTVLTHANLLNSHYMDELAEMYLKNGYTFASQAEVLEDPAYTEPVTRFGDWGISWLDRWALSSGKGGSLMKEDPVTPEYVVELAR